VPRDVLEQDHDVVTIGQVTVYLVENNEIASLRVLPADVRQVREQRAREAGSIVTSSVRIGGAGPLGHHRCEA
jgi:hypothetical protein